MNLSRRVVERHWSARFLLLTVLSLPGMVLIKRGQHVAGVVAILTAVAITAFVSFSTPQRRLAGLERAARASVPVGEGDVVLVGVVTSAPEMLAAVTETIVMRGTKMTLVTLAGLARVGQQEDQEGRREDVLAVRSVRAVRVGTQPAAWLAESGQHENQQQEDRLMSRERRPGLGGVSAQTTCRSTGGLGVPGKRTLTQGLVQRKARAAASMDPPPVYEESRATIDLGGGGGAGAGEVGHDGAIAGRAAATIDAPAAWDESLGRPTIATSASADAAGAVAAQGDAEPGWVQRARAYHAAHAAAAAAFDRLTWGACVGEDGALDPRKVARWQADHDVAPDGRVGEATLDAARAAGRGAGAAGGGDRSATSEPVSIDAPAQYDEVDRGTLEVGAAGGAAVSAGGGDRSATSEPVSIDAPARYDEVDRGTLAVGGAVQRRATQAGTAENTGDPVAVAAAGVEGAAAPLPHLGAIQASFGPHDVTGVRAQVGGAGAAASDALGAEAYATGDRVSFAASPSLHTAAHEAAHVVQQRAGVQLKGGVGQAGDAYEQHADAVADAVVRGKSAAGLLDSEPPRGAPASGGALQLIPMPSGGASVAREARDTIDANEPADVKQKKEDLLAAIKDATSGMFDLLGNGVDKATDGLRIVDAKPQRLASVAALLELAATAAVGGGAGMVGTLIVGRAWADVRERAVVDTIKDGIKTAILKGAGKATPIASEAVLLLEFADIQKFKIHEAKMLFQQEFWESTIGRLRALDLVEIKEMSAAALASATDRSLVAVQEQRTVVEWVNYLARQHHGAMEWEPRMPGGGQQQGDDENAFSFVRTDAVSPAHEGSDPFASNVDPEGVLHLMDDEQRKMQEAHHGLLEIHVWHPRGGTLELYTGDSRGGMRLDNVTDYVRSTLRKLGTVGAARVNKLIRLYVDRGQDDINPRKPEGAILVTADGYIRRVDHLTLESDELARIVNGVNGMSLEALR